MHTRSFFRLGKPLLSGGPSPLGVEHSDICVYIRRPDE